MPYTGEYVPNYGQMGTENLPSGNGMAVPYGQAPRTSGAPTDSVFSMQGPQDSARADVPYHPEAGRGDRLAANVPFVSGSYYNGRGSNV